MSGENELPEGWVETTLGNITTWKKGKKPNFLNEAMFEDSIPYIDIEAFSTGNIKKHAEISSSNIVYKDDLLVVWDGARCGLIGRSPSKGALGSTLMNIKPNLIDKIFLFYFIYSKFGLINSNPRGTGIPHVDPDLFWVLDVPLPPLAEQRRIVAAAESLLSRVNASRDRLDRASALLKAFRQAVLAAACSGRLTEGWRGENSELSSTISEKKSSDADFFHNIPVTWEITQLSRLTDLTSGNAFKKSEYSENGVKLLQIANVSFGKIIWDDLMYLPEEYLEKFPNLSLKEGDMLMALNRPILGGKLKIGILNTSDTPAILYQRVGRFDLFNPDVKHFLYLFLNSPFFISNLQKELQGVDQPFIRKSKLLSTYLPLPPIADQHEIVRRVEVLFAHADRIEQRVNTGKERADRLTQTILAKAFRGELVPTEAELARIEGREYEPASVLLERIKAERAKDSPKRKRK